MQKGRTKRNYIGLLVAAIFVMQIFALPVIGREIEKSVDKTDAMPGEDLAYTIRANFTENASNVTIADYLPDGLVYINDSLNGTLEGKNITWDLGDVNESIVQILLNASIAETYNGTAIANNSVNLSYKANGANYTTGASSPEVKIEKLKINITFITGYDNYIQPLLNASQDNAIKSIANISVFWSPNDIPDNINLSNQNIIVIVSIGYPILDKISNTVNDAKDNGAYIIIHGTHDILGLSNVNLSDSNYSDFTEYWYSGGNENMKRLITFLGVKLCNIDAEIQPPVSVPLYGIYHPDAGEVYINTSEYLEWYNTIGKYNSSRPTIGIHFGKMAGVLRGEDSKLIDTLVRTLEASGVNVIATSFSESQDPDRYKHLILNNASIVDAVIIIKGLRLDNYNTSAAIEYLEKLDVPALRPIKTYYQGNDEWNVSHHGIPPSEIAMDIRIPELDGTIEPIYIAGKEKDPVTGTTYYEPVKEQIDWLVNRTISWTELRHKNNSDKKIAIIYWHESPGKDHVGVHVDGLLDTVPSLVNFLGDMKERGYSIGNTTPNSTELLGLMLSQGCNIGVWAQDELDKMVENYSTALIPESEYSEWFNELPENKRDEVIAQWGEPPGEIMVYENETGKYLVIPKVSFGNVLLAPQPVRGREQNASIMWCDKAVVPHHQYIAFYFWLKKEFRADAIVHFGTHGTHELLPGKENGLSIKSDWPAILIQDMPNIYPEIMYVNPGRAKTRGNALTPGYLMPVVTTAGLYGNLSNLEHEIQLYDQTIDEAVKNKHREIILEQCTDLNLDQDLGVNLSEMAINTTAFDAFKEQLHNYLSTLKTEYMPYGLHILGEPPSGDSLVSMVISMLGYEFKEYVVQTNLSENCTKQLIEDVIFNGTSPEDAQNKILGNVSNNLTAFLNLSIVYADNIKLCTIEIPRTLDALEGKYISPGPSGDPMRNPDAIPTGRNLHFFDPRVIPPKAAWHVGTEMMDQLLDQHLNKTNGTYPRKVGFVLWASETMTHQGTLESEILYLLGVKPKWDSNGRVEDVELINGSELGRPRIDVIVTTSSAYRNHFSDKMKLIAKAVRLAAEANDTVYPNYVKENSNLIYQALIKAGYNESVAYNLSMARVFTEPPDAHGGTGLHAPLHESHAWENESELADAYINRMSYVYGENIWGEHYKDLFRQNLNGTEIAVFSRSSNQYGLLYDPHPAEYFGGLSLAIRSVSGESPDMYINNLMDSNNPRVETLSQFLTRELRTRYFNPYWIEGMQEHGYHGAAMISDGFVEGLWAWEATNPDIITDSMWNEVFEVYIQDKYDMGLKDWFNENNPYAEQSITARMLEAIRKEYWNPSADVKTALAETYQKSVEDYGITCCGHTCANPFINDYVSGLLPASMEPAEPQGEEPSTKISRRGGGGSHRTEEEIGLVNETAELSGVSKAGEEFKKPPEETGGETAEKVKKGRVMKEEEPASTLPISGAPLMGLIVVIVMLVFVGVGFWLKARKR
ncbi:MAG: cobaltochelatase subunit CobN [Halobacteriota archaeon]